MHFKDENNENSPSKIALVLGVTSDIGLELTYRLIDDGWSVIGFGRDLARAEMKPKYGDSLKLIYCDLSDTLSVETALVKARELGINWDLFISAAGTMEPIGRFFDIDFKDFSKSLDINVLGQLEILHGVWPFRTPNVTANIMLLAG